MNNSDRGLREIPHPLPGARQAFDRHEHLEELAAWRMGDQAHKAWLRLNPGYPRTRNGAYIASRASIPARSASWRRLREVGWIINSSWIDAISENEATDLSVLWVRIEAEIRCSERLILYVEPDDLPLKGAFVEVGMAIASGVKVYVVAPGVNIDPVNRNPLGSWACHPNVRIVRDMEEALAGAARRERFINRVADSISRLLCWKVW